MNTPLEILKNNLILAQQIGKDILEMKQEQEQINIKSITKRVMGDPAWTT